MVPGWASRYIGIPYLEQGRGMDGCDCYGLVRIIYREQFSVDLPIYSNNYDNSNERLRLIAEGLSLLDFIQVTEPELGDLVQLKYFGEPCHLGLYLGDRMMIHASKFKDTCIESIDSASIRSRIIGFFRIAKGES